MEKFSLTPVEQQEETAKDWKVYFGSGFWKHRGRDRAGDELRIGKSFVWNQRMWHVPAVYVCKAGVVVDFCMEVEPGHIKQFVEKIEKCGFDETRFSEEERVFLESENPMNMDFCSKVMVNGTVLDQKNGYSMTWIPQNCRPEEIGICDKKEMLSLMEHYKLNAERGWVVFRRSFPWEFKRKPVMKQLSIQLEPRATEVTALKFKLHEVGNQIAVIHPKTGVEHVVTVQSIVQQTLDKNGSFLDGYEYPTNFTMMSYTIIPELPRSEFYIGDCRQSDEPKRKSTADGNQADGISDACAIGIIGGADGPTAVFLLVKKPEGQVHAACSALRFEPVEEVEWKAVFMVKLCEAIEVTLI